MLFLLLPNKLYSCFGAIGLRDLPKPSVSLQATGSSLCGEDLYKHLPPDNSASNPVPLWHITPLKSSCIFEKAAVFSPGKSVQSSTTTKSHHQGATDKNLSSLQNSFPQNYLSVLSGSI